MLHTLHMKILLRDVDGKKILVLLFWLTSMAALGQPAVPITDEVRQHIFSFQESITAMKKSLITSALCQDNKPRQLWCSDLQTISSNMLSMSTSSLASSTE